MEEPHNEIVQDSFQKVNLTPKSPAFLNSGYKTPSSKITISDDFREMPYIGKTAGTPISKTPKSRNGNPSVHVNQMYSNFKNYAQSQKAAYRYKILEEQAKKLNEQKEKLNSLLDNQNQDLDKLTLESRNLKNILNKNPDDVESFQILIEIQELENKIKNSKKIETTLEAKQNELDLKIKDNFEESDQMLSLLDGMSESEIQNSYDLAIEVKSLEIKIDELKEEESRMKAFLNQKSLLQEFDNFLFKNEQFESDKNESTETIIRPDILSKLRAMEENHILSIQELSLLLSKDGNINEITPRSVDEACHSLKQKIIDLFGSSFIGDFASESKLSLLDLIKKLQSQVKKLMDLKITNFFNVEDGMIDIKDQDEHYFKSQQFTIDREYYETIFEKDASLVKTGENFPPDTRISHQVPTEKLSNALSKQIQFL